MSGGNIHAFARRGVLRELTQLVELYAADVNEADVHKMTPLHYAAKRGFTDIIKYLIERGAEIEKRNGTGQTPLMTAAQNGQTEVVEQLMMGRADPNGEADHGFRPLHRAAAAGHEDVVRMLLKWRADPLCIDGFMMEGAIHHAAREGHSDVVRVLMGSVTRPLQGADDFESDSVPDYSEALAAAHETGETDSKLVGICGLRAQSIDQGNSRGETALHLAAAHGRLDCVRLLLKMSTEGWKDWWINRKDGRSGDTALHRACAERQPDVVRLLLDEKANTSLTNQLGRTPMHLAVKAGDASIVKYLLRAGASQVSVDLDGRRPIAAGAGPWAQPPPGSLGVENWSHNIKDTSEERELKHHHGSMVKMALSDMGTGFMGARQSYITKTRQENADSRRKAAWRISAAGGFTGEDVKRREEGNEARNRRQVLRKYEAERNEVELHLRSAWAHAKIKAVWQVYKLKKEEERRERERQRRKQEADRIRREQTLGAKK